MTRYTLMLLQEAYPDQIEIIENKTDKGIFIDCWLLNKDKTPHMMLFDGGPFKDKADIDYRINQLLNYKI